MDYMYEDHLRWGLGYENPNMAGVFVACAIPWVWAWLGWVDGKEKRQKILRGIGWLVNVGLWFLLMKTYSRGAWVGALAGVGYWIVTMRGAKRKWAFGLVMLLFVLGLAWSTEIGRRLAEGMMGMENSMMNRLRVWKGGLQMLADCPMGVGTGRSGEMFMQWYQPMEMKTGYRTLVNSYLTLATEQGLIWFGLMAAGALFLWVATREHLLIYEKAARISLLIFAVCGIFSTTFERPSLWIIPGLGFVILVVGMIRRAVEIGGWGRWVRRGIVACSGSLLIVVMLYGLGWWWNRQEPLARNFVAEGRIMSLVPRGKTKYERWVWLIDLESGAKYGKSARRWCVEGGREVWCGTGNKRKDVIKWLPGHMAGLMMTGDRVRELGWIQKRCKYDRLILIMPAPCEEWEEISSAIRSYPTTVYVPCVDVDGRGTWWKHRMNGIESVQVIEMEGLGIDCWWLWPEMLI